MCLKYFWFTQLKPPSHKEILKYRKECKYIRSFIFVFCIFQKDGQSINGYTWYSFDSAVMSWVLNYNMLYDITKNAFLIILQCFSCFQSSTCNWTVAALVRIFFTFKNIFWHLAHSLRVERIKYPVICSVILCHSFLLNQMIWTWTIYWFLQCILVIFNSIVFC